MNLFNKKLNRNLLVDKLTKYRQTNKFKDDNYYKDYIKIIEQEFSKSKFVSDSDFKINGRRKFLVNEFYEVLNDENNYNKKHVIDNPLYFALGNLEEILYGNNMVFADDVDKDKWILQEDGTRRVNGIYIKEIRDIDLRYSNKKIICLEEKELIEEMIKHFKLKLERGNEMKDELKVNNNIQFDSEETKQEFSNYIDEINEYNRKIKNGEETDVNPADLLNKYREKFYDEELENKMKEIDNQKENFKIENNETDELLNKIDQRISELDEEYKD